MTMLVNTTPEQIPADEIAEQLRVSDKTEGLEGQVSNKDTGS